MSLIPESLQKAFSRLLRRESGQSPAEPQFLDVDRKDLTLCVIDEFDTTKKTNDFIASKWSEIAQFVEDGLSAARPMEELEAGYVDAIRTVEQAIHQAGTSDPKIRVSKAALETLVRDGGFAYVAKNTFMARMGDMPLSPPDIENLPPASRDILAATFAVSPEKQNLLQKQERLAMFVIKSREALGRYVPEAAAQFQPAAEL